MTEIAASCKLRHSKNDSKHFWMLLFPDILNQGNDTDLFPETQGIKAIRKLCQYFIPCALRMPESLSNPANPNVLKAFKNAILVCSDGLFWFNIVVCTFPV